MSLLHVRNVARATDANGDAVSGAIRYIYEAGTTTLTTAYSDVARTNAQSNPLTSDGGGVFAESYLAPGSYKIKVTDSAGVVLEEVDFIDITTSSQTYGSVESFLASTDSPLADGLVIDIGPYRYTVDSTAASGTYIENSASTPMRVVPIADPGVDFTPALFGAVADGTDASAELQAWIDFLEANPNVMGVLDRSYSIATGLTIQSPVVIRGLSFGDTNTEASEPSDPKASLVALTADMDMLTVASATPGEYIYGVGLENIGFEGANLAARGLVVESCQLSTFSGWCERCRVAGADFNDNNGVKTAFIDIPYYWYQGGSNAACRAGLGLRIDSVDQTNGSATSFSLGNIWCKVQEVAIATIIDSSGDARFQTSTNHNLQVGDEVWIYNIQDASGNEIPSYQVDRGVVDTVFSVTAFSVTGVSYVSGGTGVVAAAVGLYLGDIDNSTVQKYHGSSIYFGRDDRGKTPAIREARKNTVVHAGGSMLVGDGSLNTVLNLNSEPSDVIVLANDAGARGDGVLNFKVIDRNDGQEFQTQPYLVSDVRFLQAREASLANSATEGVLAGSQFPVATLDAAATSRVTWAFVAPSNWPDGKITKLTLYYTGADDSGNNFIMDFGLESQPVGVSQGSYDVSETGVTVAAPTANNTLTVHEWTPTTPLTFAEGDLIGVQVLRDGGHASDTATVNTSLVQVGVHMQANGPSDGVWQWPDRYND